MRLRRRFAILTTGLAVAALTACTGSTVVTGSEVRVAIGGSVTSFNAASSFGRASSANADVAALTGTGFGYADPASDLVLDESFGTAEIFARDPLTVRYTVASGARWSDGAPIDAVDLLLAWAANSGALNDPEFDDRPFVDPESGRYTEEFPRDVVWFDGARAGAIELATQTPQLGGERTLFVHFDRLAPDWQTALAPGVAAHALARHALALDEDATVSEAKAAVAKAVETSDRTVLAALARAWNSDLDLVADPDPALLLSSGPYVLEETDADGGAVLIANPEYSGDRRPTIETIRLRVSSDPLETVALLDAGEIDVATPAPSEDVVSALAELDDVTVESGVEARFEHLDLQFDDGRNATFDDPLVREAFLLTVPRSRLVDDLVAPLHAEALPLDSFVVRESADAYDAAVDANGSAAYARPDLARASALLVEAGVEAPKVCILFDPENPRRQAAFDLIAQSAGEVGFRVSDCSRSNWESLLGVAGAYDAALFAWDTSRLGPEAVAAVFHSDSAVVNLNRYANSEVDALVTQLAETDEPTMRASILTEIDSLIWADAYGVPLYSYPTLTAVSDSVAGVSRSPLARGVFWNAWEWRLAD